MEAASNPSSATPPAGAALRGGGEMGAIMRAFDWGKTVVGPVESWPQSLRTALSILLDSQYPMYIAWGPEFIEFYNDAFRPILGSKHPVIGGRSPETWAEIWADFVGPLFAKVHRGEATYLEDTLVPLYRHGYMEECYFTFSYSPIRNESGAVGGVLVTCIETTNRVASERRLRTLRDLGNRTVAARTPESACRMAVSAMAANTFDLPFVAVYLVDQDARAARFAGGSGVDTSHRSFPEIIDFASADAARWRFRDAATLQQIVRVDVSAVELDPVPSGPWPEAPRECAIIPVSHSGDKPVAAFIIAGISARRSLNADYQEFLNLVAGELSQAIAGAQALVDARASKAEMEAKAEELQQTAVELELQSEELRAATDGLQELNQRLSVNEERVRLANTAAGIGTWELDVSSDTFTCDEQCRTVLGLAADTPTYAQLSNAAMHEDRNRVHETLSVARTRQEDHDHTDFGLEFRVPGASGGPTRWVSLTGRSLFGAGTGIRGPQRVVGTVYDVTARHRAEDALREETQIVETIQRVGTALTSELDLPALVQTVTDEATKLTGAQFGAFFYNLIDHRGESYTLYTISGVPREAFSKFPMPRNTHVFEPTFRGTGVVRSDDITQDPRYGKNAPYYGKPAGHLPVISYLAVPVLSRSGEVLGGLFFGHEARGVFTERHERLAIGVAGWAAVAIDNARLYDRERRARTDAEEARREAEQANRAKTEFLATMSHELRTPLNAIAGYVDLLDLEIRGPITDQQRDDLRRIHRSQQLLLSLINDILNFAKLEAGQVEFYLTTIPVGGLLADIEQLMSPQITAKGLTYSCVNCDGPHRMRADAEKARQIILNLLTNAVKFTDAGGGVTVECVTSDGMVEVRVSDTGRGIPVDKLDTIFEPFVQVDRHLTPTGNQGVGLGLAISRDLARAMGGDIIVSSKVGQGSTFTLTLPRVV